MSRYVCVCCGRWKAERDNCRDLGVKREAIDLVLEGMEKACAPGGTGWPLFNFKIYKSTNLQMENSEASQTASKQAVAVPVACKTGTAEFGDPKNPACRQAGCTQPRSPKKSLRNGLHDSMI
jgi:cell division protein FtsI/penicillin-binding protein 2